VQVFRFQIKVSAAINHVEIYINCTNPKYVHTTFHTDRYVNWCQWISTQSSLSVTVVLFYITSACNYMYYHLTNSADVVLQLAVISTLTMFRSECSIWLFIQLGNQSNLVSFITLSGDKSGNVKVCSCTYVVFNCCTGKCWIFVLFIL